MLLSFLLQIAFATVTAPNYPNSGIVSPDQNGYLDERVDYSKFIGRVSDRDDSGHVIKVKVENNNTKFFKIGDEISFYMPNRSPFKRCFAHVRTTEDFYFTAYVKDTSPCAGETYFKIGTMLQFISEDLGRRVFEASKYRAILIERRRDMLNQLNDINHFVWSYDQHRIKAAAEYDRRILDLQKQKAEALDNLVTKNHESIVLQKDLKFKLDMMDENLKHFTIERQEMLTDRWELDHDMGNPVGHRPQELKAKNNK